MLAEELHRKYRTDLAEAKELDRRQAALAFLETVEVIGGFEIAPLSLRKYLFLEYHKSPFLLGTEESLKKEDVISFLWVMSPDFEPTEKSKNRFRRRHFFKFLLWQKIAFVMGEHILRLMEKDRVPTSSKKEAPKQSTNWVAKMVDGAASQYGWTEDQILDLPLSRAMAYMKAMAQRLGGDDEPEFSPNADKVRHWYLSQIQKHTDAEQKRGGLRDG